MKKSKTIQKTGKLMEMDLGVSKTEKIIKEAQIRFENLVKENQNESKAVKKHTHSLIYPYISLFETLQKNGISDTDAVLLLDKYCSKEAEKEAASLKSFLKIPFFYKLYPKMYSSVAKSSFGTKSGFTAKFYDMGKNRCKFDMTNCLFYNVCEKYGCTEIVRCFCHTDDVKSEGIHPKIVWNRTITMGDGGSYCDFDIYVDENK